MFKRDRTYDGLLDAAYALDEQAAGRQPERRRLLAGAVALDILFRRGELRGDLQDAAIALEQLVTQGVWPREYSGYQRVSALAQMVRNLADSRPVRLSTPVPAPGRMDDSVT